MPSSDDSGSERKAIVALLKEVRTTLNDLERVLLPAVDIRWVMPPSPGASGERAERVKQSLRRDPTATIALDERRMDVSGQVLRSVHSLRTFNDVLTDRCGRLARSLARWEGEET